MLSEYLFWCVGCGALAVLGAGFLAGLQQGLTRVSHFEREEILSQISRGTTTGQDFVCVCVCVRRILKERRFFAELQQGVRVCVCVSGDPRVII